MPNKDDELGALWARTTRDGRPFWTGKIGDQDVVVFPNDRKTHPKAPDFRIFKSTPREDQS